MARAARVGDLSYMVLEMNPEKVRGHRPPVKAVSGRWKAGGLRK
ncbi:hypothetical protein [Candidatus Methanocrinis natronophilus]|uniref:Transposase n=1 Tax=Candidatus Methanocrinis natronophilus TaxID=3033396 RepID=A0ABT5X5B5_9EURY|nr:hypothetical protein [Candidatus Methanocrinis natronophilus]MDF0589843.1 hypothetical protein [Candidatus Methanocrinis natronophilus]